MPDPIKEALDRRTEEGRLLRSTLDAITLEQGQNGKLVTIMDKNLVEVGIAVKTKSGLIVKAHASTGFTKETMKNFKIATSVSW